MAIRSCRDCGSAFRVDTYELEWGRAQGVSLPRRCVPCRAKRRGLSDSAITCASCSTEFTYTAALSLLVGQFGWDPPTRCLTGCAGVEDARRKLRGERRKIAELWERMAGLVHVEPVAVAKAEAEPTRPDDLFKGLDAMLAKAADEAADKARMEMKDAGEEDDLPRSLARAGEKLPSPEDLFRSLESASRKTNHDA